MAKNEFIKRPGELTEYTPENVQDLYSCAQDPIYFGKKYVKVVHPKKGPVPFIMFPYQERMIKGFLEHRWVIVKAGRQLGKTTCIAVYLLWIAMFQNNKNILVASKDNAASIDIMDRIRYAYEELPMWLKPGVKIWNRHSIEFDNGSTIISTSTTENTGRGKSISCVTGSTKVTIRNKKTGVIETLPIGELVKKATSSINTSLIDEETSWIALDRSNQKLSTYGGTLAS